MKRPLGFDPRDYDYGAPTDVIRSIVGRWSEIDWFEPTATADARAVDLFREHQRLAHAARPELFPKDVDARVVRGEHDAFVSWCRRVQTQTSWDWKFGALKRLSHLHATARGWSLDAQARGASFPPRPGDLFVRIGDGNGNSAHVIWNSFLGGCNSFLGGSVPEVFPTGSFRDSAMFYIGYAGADVVDCIQWQLAENTSEMSGNPFFPLLLCYQAGVYPFSLGPGMAVLFRFDGRPAS